MATINPNNLSNYLVKKVTKGQRSTFRKWQSKAKPLLKDSINEYIDKGASPVAGQGSFKKYSASYKKQIRRYLKTRMGKAISPVNLTLSGEMRKSLKVKNSTYGISALFKSKLANYHNRGKGNLPRRAIIPIGQESFNKIIKKRLSDLYIKLFNI